VHQATVHVKPSITIHTSLPESVGWQHFGRIKAGGLWGGSPSGKNRGIDCVHQATLHVKLHILTMHKQMAHQSALERPTTRAMDQRMVSARCSVANWWTSATWRDWCNELKGGPNARPARANLPMHEKRCKQKELVSGTARVDPKGSRKRTPFTLKREGRLIQSGVRRSIFKPVHKKPAMAMQKKPAKSVLKRPSCRS